MLIKHKYSIAEKQYAISKGANGGDFLHTKSLNLDNEVQDIRYQLNESDKPVVISKDRQLRYLQRFLKKPLEEQQTFIISSGSSDLPARQLGLSLFMTAIKTFREQRVLLERMPPYWHRLYGGYNDSLLSKETGPSYSFLVISNVIDDITNLKLEKLRDILVRFESTPKVVLVGTNRPLYLFRQRLLYPFTGCVHVGPAVGQVNVRGAELL